MGHLARTLIRAYPQANTRTHPWSQTTALHFGKGNMDPVLLIVGLALIQFLVFGALAGKARATYGVEAPAVTGHPGFERRFRVQQNTLEQLVIFIPSILIFQLYWSPNVAAALGVVFIVGRLIYYRGYVEEPGKRSLGFGIGVLAQLILLLGAVSGALLALFG